MLLNSDLISRLRRQNVWSIGQPEFIASLGDAYISALGEQRAFRLSPYANLEEHGVAQAFSSDCPVVPGSPIAGMRAAVERRTPNGVILNKSERISAEAALYAYTAASAYATRTDRHRGTLSVGKVADFAVLSEDPLAASGPKWDELRVGATFVGGECLFGGNSL
jgi:predicted amidohydrolase YtcJ